jgi:hypothetical protein
MVRNQYCHAIGWIEARIGLVIGFCEHLQNVTTTVSLSYTLQRPLQFLGVEWDWVHLVRRPLSDLLYQARIVDDGECGTVGGMRIGRGNRSTRRKPAPVSLSPLQIPNDLTWARTRTAAVGSRRLTAWAMARPKYHCNYSTHKVFTVFISRCLVAAFNGGRSPSSRLPNCRRPQLSASHNWLPIPLSESYFTTGRALETHDQQSFNWTLAVIVFMSNERMDLSFTIAAGARQRSHSRVRVPRDSWPHFTVSHSRLSQPGGPGPRNSIIFLLLVGWDLSP